MLLGTMHNANVMKDLLITLVYFDVCKARLPLHNVVNLECFRTMVDLEQFTDAELVDVEYMSQRMSIWIDNNPAFIC